MKASSIISSAYNQAAIHCAHSQKLRDTVSSKHSENTSQLCFYSRLSHFLLLLLLFSQKLRGPFDYAPLFIAFPSNQSLCAINSTSTVTLSFHSGPHQPWIILESSWPQMPLCHSKHDFPPLCSFFSMAAHTSWPVIRAQMAGSQTFALLISIPTGFALHSDSKF